jgi:hypothetical protein
MICYGPWSRTWHCVLQQGAVPTQSKLPRCVTVLIGDMEKVLARLRNVGVVNKKIHVGRYNVMILKAARDMHVEKYKAVLFKVAGDLKKTND